MTGTAISVVADLVSDNGQGTAIALKISCAIYEINIRIPEQELEKIQHVKHTDWQTGAIAIGTAVNETVFWSCDNDIVTLLVGDDDQSWDIAVSFDLERLLDIIDEITVATGGVGPRAR